MDNLKTLHDRWIKNRSCIHFSVSIRLLDGKIQAELKDAPPQYRKALLSMMEMIMSNGVLYIKAAYHDAIRKKGLDVNEKKVHDDLDLRLVPLIDMLRFLPENTQDSAQHLFQPEYLPQVVLLLCQYQPCIHIYLQIW